jgi:hypothetical protein
MVAGEQIILDLARQHGILTPKANFARVQINSADLGVYHYEAQPDESLLRINGRIPGSMYSGNLPPSAKTDELWTKISRWKKVAWRAEDKKNRADMARLLERIGSASLGDFADFAREELDLRAFATFDALDVVFGGDQHDFRQNHKLYFDPYRGRWEPIAWNFRGFKHGRLFNLVDNPLLLRLKMVPEYLTLRNQILYELLVGDCRPTAIRSRGMKILKKLARDLASDPHWDAYKLLPAGNRFYRRMVRPMNPYRLALVFESEMTTLTRRHAYLVGELTRNPLWILMNEEGQTTRAVHLIVDGRAGVRLTGFRARWPEGCKPAWQIIKEGLPVTPESTGELAELSRPLDLYPGVGLVTRTDSNPKRGNVRSEMLPVSYPFLLRSACAPVALEAEGLQLATGSRVRSRPVTQPVLDRLPTRTLGPADTPKLVAGEAGAHPWQLGKPTAERVRIGPGVVEITDSRAYAAHQSVEIEPGTQLKMGAGASLIFRGPVAFRGSRAQPIVIERSGEKPWGGIALVGKATAGSLFRQVTATGGSLPESGLIPFPGMLNLHDTRRILIRDCRLGNNTESDDVVHAAYVDQLTIEDTRIEDAATDAFDLEFASGSLRRLVVARAGDEALDLMASRIELSDSALLGCGGSGISAGEESQIDIRDTLVAASKVGVLAKNASRVELSDSLLFGNQTGVWAYQKEVRYQGASRIQADVLFVVGSQTDIKREDRQTNTLDIGRIQRRLPRAGALEHLGKSVLGLPGWRDLAPWVAARAKGGVK